MPDPTAPAQHEYLSTACYHELHDNRPELHAKCRAVCKYGDTPEMCRCPNHVEGEERDDAEVDVARKVARALLDDIDRLPDGRYLLDPDLRKRLEFDPSLWWLREGEQSPGEWRRP
jgi:hypothetical protein